MARIVKKYEKNYTVISNSLINDSSLSWKAKGIFVHLWSRPDDWDFYEEEVMKHASDGKSSLRSGLKELEDRGYLKRVRARNEKGQLTSSYWELWDTPNSENHNLDNRNLENHTLQSNDLTKYPSKQKKYKDTSSLEDDDPNFIELKEIDDKNIQHYAACYFNKFGKEHARIPKDRVTSLVSGINEFEYNDIYIEVEDIPATIKYHFDRLPKNNDGKIYSFLHEGYRNRIINEWQDALEEANQHDY